MKVTNAIVCEVAHVRDNLLYVLAGGFNQLNPPRLPGPVQFYVAATIELSDTDWGRRHEIRIGFKHTGNLDLLAEVGASFEVAGPDDAALRLVAGQAPFALPLAALVPEEGVYNVEIRVNKRLARTIALYVRALERAPTP